MNGVISALLGGLVGAILGPIILHRYQEWYLDKYWKKPRKELLLVMLNDKKFRFKSIKKLSRTIGATEDETRSLLIDLGARGARLKSGSEGWALISRAPLTESLRQIEAEEEEQDS